MKHPDSIKSALRAASLPVGQDLDDRQLERAQWAVEQRARERRPQLKGIPLAKFILQGGRSAGPPPEPLTMGDAAKKVLGDEGRPLRPREIFELAKGQGLIASAGKTPEKTMATRLAVGVRRGEFRRTAPNTFELVGPKEDPVPIAA